MSVSEPSYAVKRRNDYRTEGRRLALRAGLPPQLELWLGLAWLVFKGLNQIETEFGKGYTDILSLTKDLRRPQRLCIILQLSADTEL